MSTSRGISFWRGVRSVLRALFIVGAIVLIIAVLPADAKDRVGRFLKTVKEKAVYLRQEWRDIWGEDKVYDYIHVHQ